MSQEEISNTQQEGATPVTEPVEQAAPVIPMVQLRRDQMYQELSRLSQEDPELRQVLGTWAGNTAKRQYVPEIRARDTELAQLKAENFQLKVTSMTEAEIQDKFAKDKSFRDQYSNLLETQQNGGRGKPTDEAPLVNEAVNELAQWAYTNGLPEADWNRLYNKAMREGYSGPNEHWSTGVMRWQQEISQELIRQKLTGSSATPPPAVTTPPPMVPETPPKINPNLTRPGADISRGTGGNSTNLSFPKTAAEFNKLPRNVQQQFIASDRDKVIGLT